ncbi:AraC family transcriptional regulator [Pseudomonas frederiksbergensis]|uniref:AraC family transcriptional regulator n=1 Tax=Pseudomonas frederiksbergensis TaxID=104087 RepID=A0A423JQC2_9PSED|nr:AraC family transcriptional regulator [Pseudomonas frederiksbergensis]RON39891.1 AraC family transcriptional regulator [Pseudomonas frederiksbergensis]
MLSQRLLGDRLCLQLLPRAAYSARDPAQWHTLGVTLERQQGVHAIDSDRRVDFDTLPGVLAHTPVGVEVFSESDSGGEYLLLRLDEQFARQHLPSVNHRVQSLGQSQALGWARTLRRLMLDPQPDGLALEHAALQLVGQASVQSDYRTPPKAFTRVLDQIAEQFHLPLSLEQLAATYGHNELRFLRDFTRTIGLTPHAYLIEVRLQAARRMIEQTDLPLANIALDAGFAHQSHMGSAFRKHLAMTPSQYRSRF